MPWYQWVLSGVGVAVPLALIGWFVQRKQAGVRQSQKLGKNSTGVQAGRDVNAGSVPSESASDAQGVVSQKQRTGEGSVGFQAGRDVNLPGELPESGSN